MDVIRQGHAFLPQNVRQKNVDDMRRKTSIYVRFAVRTFCDVTMHVSSQLSPIFIFKVKNHINLFLRLKDLRSIHVHNYTSLCFV
jgi:hypothetical protein